MPKHPADDNALPRTERLTILLTTEEMAELRERARLVALSVWVRSLIFGTATMEPYSGPVDPTRGAEKISDTPVLEKPGVRVRRVAELAQSLPNTSLGVPNFTHQTFSETLATIPLDEVDVWARGLPAELLPKHTAESQRHTCLCRNCLEWRRTNAIPYGGPKKKER